VLEGTWLELLLERNREHDNLVALIRFVSCHVILRLYHLFDSFNGLRYAPTGYAGAGVDSAWEQRKLEARKLLENRAESPASSVCCVGQLLLFRFNLLNPFLIIQFGLFRLPILGRVLGVFAR
jgi:hypothetical protein